RRGSRQRSFVAGDQADPDRICHPGEKSGTGSRRKLNIHAFDGRGTSQLRQETMRTGHMRFDDQRGMVLYSSLLILSLLVAVGVGARVMLQSDFKLLANMKASIEAFYVADAGIEWSKDEIRKNFSHPPILPSRAQSFSSGHFSVSFLSPKARQL